MEAPPIPTLLTLREIAKLLRVRRSRVAYACDRYEIEPRQRAGTVKLYSLNDLPRIKSALARIEPRGTL